MAAPGPRLGICDAIAANRWRTVALVAAFASIVSALAYAADRIARLEAMG